MRYLSILNLILGLGCPTLVWACPSCKDALATEETMALARGFGWSIMMMVSLPFVIVGTVAFLIIRARRNKEVNNQGTEQVESK